MRSMSCFVAFCVTNSAAGSPLTCSNTNTIVITPSMAVSESASRRIRYSLTTGGSARAGSTPPGRSAPPRRVDHRQLQVRPRRPLQIAAHAVGIGSGKEREGRHLVLVHQLQALGDVAQCCLV